MPAYGEALVEQAEREPRLVALDADLRLDTGLVAFRERFPDRFFECGIAEQDMVSQAGAMALAGLLPVVPLVRLLPLDAAERADLQQRDRALEGDLRRLARRARPGRARALAPVGARHLRARRRCPGMALIEPFSRGARCGRRVDWAVHRRAGLGLPAPRQRAVGARLRPARRSTSSSPGRGTVLRPAGRRALRRRRAR